MVVPSIYIRRMLRSNLVDGGTIVCYRININCAKSGAGHVCGDTLIYPDPRPMRLAVSVSAV